MYSSNQAAFHIVSFLMKNRQLKLSQTEFNTFIHCIVKLFLRLIEGNRLLNHKLQWLLWLWQEN